MRKIIAIALLLAFAGESYCQNFSFSKMLTQFISSAYDPVTYDDILIQNNTNQNLNLKWVRVYDSSPAAWNVQIQDPEMYHGPEVDSAFFVLDSIPGFNDLFGCFFFPKDTPGFGSVSLEVSQIDDSTQSQTITWEFTARDDRPTGIEDLSTVALVQIGSLLSVKAQSTVMIMLYDLSGKEVYRGLCSGMEEWIDTGLRGVHLYTVVSKHGEHLASGKLKM